MQSCGVVLTGFFVLVGVGVGLGEVESDGFGLAVELPDGFGSGLLLDGFGLAVLVVVVADGLEAGEDVVLVDGFGLGEEVDVCVWVAVGLAELVVPRLVVGFGVALVEEFVGLALTDVPPLPVGVADGEWLTGVLDSGVLVVGVLEAGALGEVVPDFVGLGDAGPAEVGLAGALAVAGSDV